MPNYTFQSLSPLDFESLSRDLLQKELGVPFEAFKSGKDYGIDFRYAPHKGGKVILQVKHFAGSGAKKLIQHLKNSELPKVKKLAPDRYIVSTSASLTVTEKNHIQKLFEPYILSTGDIYGRETLNGLLLKYPEVEKANFKLWLDSVNVLEEILHAKITNFSRESLLLIKDKAKSFVHHAGVIKALDMLEKRNYCIIAGMPGIGKTILTEMLALKFLDKKYDVIRILNSEEAFEIGYDKTPKFIYYDDFLGQTSSLEKMDKNEDQRLLELIASIQKQKQSKLVLTTREYILNQACQQYEKLDKSLPEIKSAIINLQNYTREIKAHILYNHLFFSGIPHSHIGSVLSERKYLKIVDHPNYNPRIIDTMTRKFGFSGIPGDKYADRLLSMLDNPEEIWKHAFENQISADSRNMLIIMASMPYNVCCEDLFLVMEKGWRIDRNAFRRALKELENSFVHVEKCGKHNFVHYHNPSIKDFIKNYIYTERAYLKQIFNSVLFWEQIAWLWGLRKDSRCGSHITTLIRSETKKFKDLLSDVDSYPECSYYIFSSGGSSSAVSVSKTPYSQRIGIQLSFLREFVGRTDSYFVDALAGVKQNLELLERKPAGNKENIWQIADAILRHELLPEAERQGFVERMKILLGERNGEIDDFAGIFDFIYDYPELFSEEEQMRVKEEFCSVVDDVVASVEDSDDPDHLRGEAMGIESIAYKLDLDLDDAVSSLEQRATELESYEPDEEECVATSEIRASLPSGEDVKHVSDEQIDSMFETLRYE